MEDGSDAYMLDYIVESLRQSSARYIIVTGSNDFTAAFIHGMGSKGMVNDHHVYIGTNYPMPFENATLYTDVIYNALDSFYDCAMNMVSGWNLLNHLMSFSLFKNTGYHGMITDPFLLTEQGDLQK
ncbi:hypothetical protein HDU77_011217 [Chytriomyces hyalinus]|nr:hypothetical protein HDU77_011217 [Chytriomyces hyalinus]